MITRITVAASTDWRAELTGLRLSASARLAVALSTIAAIAVTGLLHRRDAAVAHCFFAAMGIPLAAIDYATRRLPNKLILPAYPALGGLLWWAAHQAHRDAVFHRAVDAALLLVGSFSIACCIADVGLGDLKLSGLLGLILGYHSWDAVFDGVFAGVVLGALWTAALRMVGRPFDTVPLGTFLIAGTLLVAGV